MCQPLAGGCFLHCHTTVSSDPGLRDQLAVPGLCLGFRASCPKSYLAVGEHLSFLLVSAGTHGPAWVQVSGPLQQRRHVSANTEQNLRDGVATPDGGTQACTSWPLPTSCLLSFPVAPCPRGSLCCTHFHFYSPWSPSLAVTSSDTVPHCQGRVGGPSLCVPHQHSTALASYCCPFTCLYPLLDVSSLRTGGLSALWGCGPST